MSHSPDSPSVGGGLSETNLSVLMDELLLSARRNAAIVDKVKLEQASCRGVNKNVADNINFESFPYENFDCELRDYKSASRLLEENEELFNENEILLTRKNFVLPADELESFEIKKRQFEEAIEKYRNENIAAETEFELRLDAVKMGYKSKEEEAHNRRRELELKIEHLLNDFESRRFRVQLDHDEVLRQLSENFETRLMEIGNEKNHEKCETQMASQRSSWQRTLHGLEEAIRQARKEIRRLKNKTKCFTPSPENVKKRKIEGDLAENNAILQDCVVVIHSLDEVPDADDETSRSKSTTEISRTDSVLPGEATPTTSSEMTTPRKRLFSQESVEDPLGIITEPTENTVENYLKSLRKIVATNERKSRKGKRRETSSKPA